MKRTTDEDVSNKNMEDGSEWTPKDRKTITEVVRCCTKRHEEEWSTERRSTRTWRRKTRYFDPK